MTKKLCSTKVKQTPIISSISIDHKFCFVFKENTFYKQTGYLHSSIKIQDCFRNVEKIGCNGKSNSSILLDVDRI